MPQQPIRQIRRFVLTSNLPVFVVVDDKTYSIHVEGDPVSKQWRFFAKEVESAAAGQYLAYLLYFSGSKESLMKVLYTDGLELAHADPAYRFFVQLAKDGAATELPASDS